MYTQYIKGKGENRMGVGCTAIIAIGYGMEWNIDERKNIGREKERKIQLENWSAA